MFTNRQVWPIFWRKREPLRSSLPKIVVHQGSRIQSTASTVSWVTCRRNMAIAVNWNSSLTSAHTVGNKGFPTMRRAFYPVQGHSGIAPHCERGLSSRMYHANSIRFRKGPMLSVCSSFDWTEDCKKKLPQIERDYSRNDSKRHSPYNSSLSFSVATGRESKAFCSQ